MRVGVSGKQFVFPSTCGRCGRYATTALSIAGSERNKDAKRKAPFWTFRTAQVAVGMSFLRNRLPWARSWLRLPQM